MEVPPISTRTSASVDVAPQVDLDGGIVFVVILKQAYAIDLGGEVAPVPGAAIHWVDVPHEAEGRSSVARPADVCLDKPGTDVVVVGDAVAPEEQPVRQLDVMVRVGPLQKHVRAFGPRVWYRHDRQRFVPTPPEPFTRQPVVWESARGGTDVDDRGVVAHEPRNPHGCGVAADPRTLEHRPTPSIEDPSDPITSHLDRPAPAGLAARGPDFEARLRFAGTMDQSWQDERYPLRPLDFDPRFFQVAADGLTAPEHLRGGEEVQVLHMHEAGALSFRLPRRAFYVGAQIGRERIEHRPVLDTVLLLPSELRMELTWRSTIRAPRPLKRMSGIQIWDKKVLS